MGAPTVLASTALKISTAVGSSMLMGGGWPSPRVNDCCRARNLACDARTQLGRSIGSKLAGVY
eukprot:6213410-Pleurochrysis_carterae.AAC.5